ncbi:uncharacterized protein LOC143034312 [Oratosquilla oratoria]|uniref:uncharacterized protein LOC143034312 n=1 Tax=Oratosquilla oratoria TaxID=337810 RepID=UPI003F7770DF
MSILCRPVLLILGPPKESRGHPENTRGPPRSRGAYKGAEGPTNKRRTTKEAPRGSAQRIEVIREEENHQVYFVLDIMDLSLEDIVKRMAKQGVSFTKSEVKSVWFQCLKGLRHVHKVGLVHCDLAARNILVDRTGSVKITDFGLAIREGENVFFSQKEDLLDLGAVFIYSVSQEEVDQIDLIHGKISSSGVQLAEQFIAEPDESVTQQPTFFSCRSGDSPAVALSPNAWFPQEKGEKALDIPALFERAQDQPKTVPPRRHIPSSFPVVLPPPFAPEGLRDCLWHSGRDPALPHQLSEPEAKLLTTEASTRQDLASTISTVTAIAMMRNWLTTLATSFEDFPREELRHTLAALSTVAEGTANMASSALPPAARAFTAARLAARQSATRSAPEIARRGVVRAAPLSRGLFDQEATDRVFATVPTVIQIQQPSQPSETRDSDHLR